MSEEPKVTRGRGFKPSPDHKKARFGAAHPTLAAAACPPAAGLRKFKPQTMDQNGTELCVGHALAVACWVFFAAAGTPLPFVPSPLGIWKNGTCLENPGTTPLQNEGISIADGITGIETEGVRPIQAPTPDGRYSDATVENLVTRPTLAEDLASLKELLPGPEQLSPSAADFLAHVNDSIANMLAGVVVGIHASPPFQGYRAGMPAIDDVSGFTETDGHGTVVLDYRTGNAGFEYWILSSWSESFGEEGGAWVTGRWLVASCIEAWRAKFTAKAKASLGAGADTNAAPAPPGVSPSQASAEPAEPLLVTELRAELGKAGELLDQALLREEQLAADVARAKETSDGFATMARDYAALLEKKDAELVEHQAHLGAARAENDELRRRPPAIGNGGHGG